MVPKFRRNLIVDLGKFSRSVRCLLAREGKDRGGKCPLTSLGWTARHPIIEGLKPLDQVI
jgi:hypothetical protein